MGVFKGMQIDCAGDFAALAEAGGYEPGELRGILREVLRECREDGCDFDPEFFVRVTLEHDW